MSYLLWAGLVIATVVLPCGLVYGILLQSDGRAI